MLIFERQTDRMGAGEVQRERETGNLKQTPGFEQAPGFELSAQSLMWGPNSQNVRS